MSKFTYPAKILFTDMDGTLLNSKKKISVALRQLLLSMTQKGARLVLSSGRALSSILENAQNTDILFPYSLIIAANGNLIYDCDNKTTLLQKGVPLDIGRDIVQMADCDGLHIQSYDDTHVVCKNNCPQLEYYIRHTGCKPLFAPDIMETIGFPPVKLLAIDLEHPKKLEDLRQKILARWGDQVTALFSCPQYLEIFDKTAGKGNAVRFVCDYLQIPVDQTVAAGDAQNDISMLEAAGIAVAMANATLEVKKLADYVTEADNDHDGLAEAILRYF